MMRLILGAAAALFLTASHAAADGLPSRGKTVAEDETSRPCSISANAGFSNQRVDRGFSENLNIGDEQQFSVQGGFDLTCGRFYAGVAGTSISLFNASASVDLSAGFRPKTGPITWDFGVIYHAYNQDESLLNYYELMAAASGDIWRGGTLGVKTLYTPDVGGAAGALLGATGGSSWTVEGNFAQVLPKVGIFTPTISAAVGQVNFDRGALNDYVYWNAGLTVSFLEKWSVDLRYSDTNIDGGCGGVCDGLWTVALRYTF